jgi:hypothetical protein
VAVAVVVAVVAVVVAVGDDSPNDGEDKHRVVAVHGQDDKNRTLSNAAQEDPRNPDAWPLAWSMEEPVPLTHSLMALNTAY